MKWEMLMNTGRWQSLHTCRVYVQDASQEAARIFQSGPATQRLQYYSKGVDTAVKYDFRQKGTRGKRAHGEHAVCSRTARRGGEQC